MFRLWRRIDSESMTEGHLYLKVGDELRDLGTVTEDDLRFLSAVCEKAYGKMRGAGVSGPVLSRCKVLAKRLYDRGFPK